MIKPAIVAAVLLLPLTSHAQIYKCEANGRTTFQDVPCGDATQSIRRGSLSTYQAPPSRSQSLQRPQRQSPQVQPQQRSPQQQPSTSPSPITRNEMVRARADGRLMEGMTEAQTISILGHPNNYESQRQKRDTCKQFRWYNPRFSPGHHYALICDGIVERYSGPRR